jgi:hypothetical protein
VDGARVSWRIAGSYFESCNCDAICPCRRIDGLPGGRSTWGECLGVLSWLIEEGHADDVSLDGAKVALATRYHDDELGSPWTFLMYVDEAADEAARGALASIFTGRFGGDALEHFPWAWKDANCAGVHPAFIELSTSRSASGFVSIDTSSSRVKPSAAAADSHRERMRRPTPRRT